MSQYRCTICGDGAISKCPQSRSVFPDDQHAVAWSYALTTAIESTGRTQLIPTGHGKVRDVPTVRVTFTIEVPEAATEAETRLQAWRRLQVDETLFRHGTCEHQWAITEGSCMFGCCVAPAPPLATPVTPTDK